MVGIGLLSGGLVPANVELIPAAVRCTGLAFAYSLCGLVNMLPEIPYFAGLLPTWQSALASFLLLSTVAVLSAIYPASRAAAVDPIEALRWEAGG